MNFVLYFLGIVKISNFISEFQLSTMGRAEHFSSRGITILSSVLLVRKANLSYGIASKLAFFAYTSIVSSSGST